MKVVQGDVLEVHAGPPPPDQLPGMPARPDPEHEVVVRGVRAGTLDLVIRLR